MTIDPQTDDYAALLAEVKRRITNARIHATLIVNRELVLLYWQIGHVILSRQEQEGWGARVIARLAADLHAAFPEMRGFSRTNLLYMRAFARAYPDEAMVQQVVGPLPWGHNILLLTKLGDAQLRDWYARSAIEYGWSRAVLSLQIESQLHLRQGQVVSNFSRTLPAPQSELAQQLFKDPYNFDFLTLGADVHERAVERGLLDHLQAFLLELGVGFAFVGSQYHLVVGGDDFYIDLLFYHLRLRCYVVIELKARDFQPGDAGQMLLYLGAADELLRHPDDQPSMGRILCRGKNKLTVEYTLKYATAPIGVAEYQITAALPAELATDFPTIEQLEAEFGSYGTATDD